VPPPCSHLANFNGNILGIKWADLGDDGIFSYREQLPISNWFNKGPKCGIPHSIFSVVVQFEKPFFVSGVYVNLRIPQLLPSLYKLVCHSCEFRQFNIHFSVESVVTSCMNKMLHPVICMVFFSRKMYILPHFINGASHNTNDHGNRISGKLRFKKNEYWLSCYGLHSGFHIFRVF